MRGNTLMMMALLFGSHLSPTRDRDLPLLPEGKLPRELKNKFNLTDEEKERMATMTPKEKRVFLKNRIIK